MHFLFTLELFCSHKDLSYISEVITQICIHQLHPKR